MLGSNILAGASGQGGDSGYQIEKSLRFNAADSAYLEKNLPTSNKKKFTFSFWMKKHANVPNGTNQTVIMAYLDSSIAESNYAAINFNSSNKLVFSTAATEYRRTGKVFRDTSAWYHIVIVYDSANATAEDRFIVYVNGVRITEWDVNTTIAQNNETGLNGSGTTGYHRIGQEVNQFKSDFSIAEWYWIDNQVKTATDFGEFDDNNIWQPKAYTGTYGTNGHYLKFADNSSVSALGTDSSGNGNNWTPNNFSVTAGASNDSLTDTPTNYGEDTGVGGEVRGNYNTLNPLHHLTSATIVDGNLRTSSDGNAFSSMLLTSGKWYAEHTVSSAGYNLCLSQPDHPSGATPSSATSKTIGWYYGGSVYYGGGYDVGGAAAYTTGDVIAAAIDIDNTTITWYKNGSQVGSVINYSTGSYPKFAEGMLVSEFAGYGIWNFGQRAWAHTPPPGYKAICTQNLPDPVAVGSKNFETILWTGQGNTNDRTLTTTISADLIWTKARNYAYSLPVWDTVRGYGAKEIRSNSPGVEGGTTGASFKSSTDTSITFEASSNGDNSFYNGASHNYVAWLWDAGSSNTSVAVGGLNSAAYNQSQVWSNILYTAGSPSDAGTTTTQNFHSGYPATLPFNGASNRSANETYAAASLQTIVFRPASAITGVTKLEIFLNGSYATDAGYNSASSVITGNSSTGWQTLYEGSAISLDYVWSYKNGGQGSFSGLKINGELLIDNGVTPPVSVPSIATTYRANPTAGFSIVSWTGNATQGATVGHGLNAPPELIIVKNRDSGSANWPVYHKGAGAANRMYLDAGVAPSAGTNWDSQDPTSSIFNIGNNPDTNGSSNAMIAYCFSSVDGYSKIGTYTGNATADPNGEFVYLGFRPAFLLIKANSGWWNILDTGRDEYNPGKSLLFANDSGAEYSGAPNRVLFLSNGFKMLSGTSDPNSAVTHYYAAFAEHPFKTTRAF